VYIDSLQDMRLDKRHIVVSERLEETVKQVVENARKATPRRKRGNFKMKERSEVELPLNNTPKGLCRTLC